MAAILLFSRATRPIVLFCRNKSHIEWGSTGISPVVVSMPPIAGHGMPCPY
jgi:hypothetical protein